MAYYQGDYYMGDYYQGDPFLGLGALAGLAVRGIGKLFGKKAGTAIAKRGAGALMRRAIPGIAGGAIGSMVFDGRRQQTSLAPPFQRGPIMRGIERVLPGGRTGLEVDCKPGQYMQKKNFIPTGKCLYRKMNVTNSKALRRSLRRVGGFGKLSSRAKRDIGRAARSVGAMRQSRGPVARHHARIRAKA